MDVKIIQRASEIHNELVVNRVAIIIDVLRASSVIVSALANGVKAVITTSETNEALSEFDRLGHENCILGGERGSNKIDGFHYGNSPLVYANNSIKDKILILTTTNGTKAIHRCHTASEIYICSILNCSFVAASLAQQKRDIVIICAGTNNAFSLEDAFCAGMLVFYLEQHISLNLGDFEIALKAMYAHYHGNIAQFLENSSSYKMLTKNGHEEDVNFCLQKNLYSILAKKVNDRFII